MGRKNTFPFFSRIKKSQQNLNDAIKTVIAQNSSSTPEDDSTLTGDNE